MLWSEGGRATRLRPDASVALWLAAAAPFAALSATEEDEAADECDAATASDAEEVGLEARHAASAACIASADMGILEFELFFRS